jgi:hypothetical protein
VRPADFPEVVYLLNRDGIERNLARPLEADLSNEQAGIL